MIKNIGIEKKKKIYFYLYLKLVLAMKFFVVAGGLDRSEFFF